MNNESLGHVWRSRVVISVSGGVGVRFTEFCDDGDVGARGDGSLAHEAMYWAAFWR